MRLHRRLLFGLAALLGAAVVVLPAVAASETTPTIEAVNSAGYYGEQRHAWSPVQAIVTAGGVVTLSNATTVPHGVEWRPGNPATPSCTNGVPVGTGEAASAPNWSGTCTFAKPGTYTFYCTVHHAEMTGTITVNANGTTTSTTTTTPTSTTPATAPATPTESPSGSPLLSGPSLRSSQRGSSVHGSLDISASGANGLLEVDLLAKSASLAKPRRSGSGSVRVGRLVRASVSAGKVSFTVAIDAKARHALRTRRRLALTVKVVLTPAHGAAVTIMRSVVLHA